MNSRRSVRRVNLALRGSLASLLVTWSAAHAVSLNPRGLGQALVFPYYTVNKGQDTLLSLGNASDTGKVVHVQFHEGMNGRVVLDFNVFLSPHDGWTARVSELGAADGAALHTSDRSCVWPALAAGEPFRAGAYNGGSLYPADGGPQGPERTREGFVSVFALGDTIPGSPLDDAIAHPAGGGAPACAAEAIGNLFRDDVVTATDDLYGAASIVNVGEGTFFAYNADALSDFTDTPLIIDSPVLLNYFKQANSLDSGDFDTRAHVLDGQGHYVTLAYAESMHAVSAVFMAESLLNEYLVAPGLGAQTDWVVTFPTRELYVDPYYTSGGALPPFPNAAVAARADVEALPSTHDQEAGQRPPADDDAPDSVILPYQVNVLSFRSDTGGDTASPVFGSTLATWVDPYGAAGWALIDLATGDGGHALPPAASGTVVHGLPATGFMVYNIINANAAPGRLANYGGAFAHRASVAHSQTPAGAAQ